MQHKGRRCHPRIRKTFSGWSFAGANPSFFEAKPDFSDYCCLSSNMVNYLSCSPLWADSFLIKLLWLNPKQTASPERLVIMLSGVGVMGAEHFFCLSLTVSLVSRNHSAREGRGRFVWLCWYLPLAVTCFFLVFQLHFRPPPRFSSLSDSFIQSGISILLEKEDFFSAQIFLLNRFSAIGSKMDLTQTSSTRAT